MPGEPPTPDLIDMVERNVEDAFLTLASLHPDAQITDTPEIRRYTTGIAHSMGNVVVRTQLEQDQTNQRVLEVMAEAKSRNLPMLWMIGPSSRPANLGEILEELGAVNFFKSAGMAANLDHLPERMETVGEIRIKEMSDPAEMEQWIAIGTEVFQMPVSVVGLFAQTLDGSLGKFRSYMAYLDDQPVAISTVFMKDGVAGMYCVATLESARRRGIGAAVTHAPLAEAKKQGCRYAILQSSQAGYRVYESLGFREVCQFQRFGFNLK